MAQSEKDLAAVEADPMARFGSSQTTCKEFSMPFVTHASKLHQHREDAMADAGTCGQRVLVIGCSTQASLSIIARLEEHGIAAQIVSDASEIAQAIRENAGAAMIDQRALDAKGVREIRRAIAEQPPWSRFPLVFITSSSDGAANGQDIFHSSSQLFRDAIFLDRTAPVCTLVSTVRFALRARQHQYEMRDFLVADMTERRRVQEALIRTEKLASAGRMAATVAHEINNPLSVVANAVYLAATHPTASPEVRGHLAIAECELERVAHLTRQTLGFYRETKLPELFRLSEIVDNVIELYDRKLAARTIRLSRSYAENDFVRAVPGEMRQIISNLLTNAIDAVPLGGRILMRTACLAALDSGRTVVRFTIADTGVGIEAGEKNEIFEPFVTSKAATGTGLGLWVTRELTAKQHGTIRVRSCRGIGTVFSTYFSAAEQAPQSTGGRDTAECDTASSKRVA